MAGDLPDIEEDRRFALTEFLADQAQSMMEIANLPEYVSSDTPMPTDVRKKIQERYTDKTLHNEEYCVLCSKISTASHKSSKAHEHKLQAVGKMDYFLGQPLTPRGRRPLHVGLESPQVTRRLLEAFWGDSLVHFPRKGLQKLRASGVKVKPDPKRA